MAARQPGSPCPRLTRSHKRFQRPCLNTICRSLRRRLAEALARLSEFRILCAVREGPYGVQSLNRIVEEILSQKLSWMPKKTSPGIYRGKPIMVTANNYNVGVFNGDVGIFWPAAKSLLVHFPDDANNLRPIARERLPEHETVYAMTVHKSQGSEFKHVLLIIPERDNPVLTRELVYTGLTRAKESVRLLCNRGQLVGLRQTHRSEKLRIVRCAAKEIGAKNLACNMATRLCLKISSACRGYRWND